jgi:DNA-binding GntR family transcriptional regulator
MPSLPISSIKELIRKRDLRNGHGLALPVDDIRALIDEIERLDALVVEMNSAIEEATDLLSILRSDQVFYRMTFNASRKEWFNETLLKLSAATAKTLKSR